MVLNLNVACHDNYLFMANSLLSFYLSDDVSPDDRKKIQSLFTNNLSELLHFNSAYNRGCFDTFFFSLMDFGFMSCDVLHDDFYLHFALYFHGSSFRAIYNDMLEVYLDHLGEHNGD